MNGILIGQTNTPNISEVLGYTPVRGLKLGNSSLVTEGEVINVTKSNLGLSNVENYSRAQILSNSNLTGIPKINGRDLVSYINNQANNPSYTVFKGGDGVSPKLLIFTGDYFGNSKGLSFKIEENRLNIYIPFFMQWTNGENQIDYTIVKSSLNEFQNNMKFSYQLIGGTDNEAQSDIITDYFDVFDEIDFFNGILKQSINTLNETLSTRLDPEIIYSDEISVYDSHNTEIKDKAIAKIIYTKNGVNITTDKEGLSSNIACIADAYVTIDYYDQGRSLDSSWEGQALKISIIFENDISDIQNNFQIGLKDFIVMPLNQWLQLFSLKINNIETRLNNNNIN